MGLSHALTPAALRASGVIRAHTKGVMRQKSRTWLTNLSRKVFSLSAPMQPAKPRMNITPPTTMKSHTGSKPPRSVIDDRLDSTPWGEKRGGLPIYLIIKTSKKSTPPLELSPDQWMWGWPAQFMKKWSQYSLELSISRLPDAGITAEKCEIPITRKALHHFLGFLVLCDAWRFTAKWIFPATLRTNCWLSGRWLCAISCSLWGSCVMF